MIFRKTSILLLALLVGACSPDDDVSAKYNAINQRALLEASGLDLSRAANNHMGYLTAKAMRRKNVLGESALTDTESVTDNPVPEVPGWIKVVECSPFSVMTYFTATPKGVSSLMASGGIMSKAIGNRFGWDSVGVQTANGTQYPTKAVKLHCINKVGTDIVVGSPIFVMGFNYDAITLPDPMKTTEPEFTRDITIPCPAGISGAVKRQQVCKLVFSDTETTPENLQIQIGTEGPFNEVQRLNKKWECTPDDNAPPEPLTTQEIADYCRDPVNDIAKEPDNTIVMQAESLKELLENNNQDGKYSFVCRSNGNGSCIAEPYYPSEHTFLRCDENIPPARFVVNPVLPPMLSPNGDLQGNPGETRDCGRGWHGELKARYMARRCNLVKVNQNGQEETVSTAQTIYQIAYAGAKCSRDMATTIACPVMQGSDPNKRLPVVRRYTMNDYLALDWTPTKNVPKAWNNTAPATRDSRGEVLGTALAQGFVVSDMSQTDLNSVSVNDEIWSEAIVDAMNRSKPGSASKNIISCDNSGNPCSNGAPDNNIEIWVDTAPLRNYGGAILSLPQLVCTTNTSPERPVCNPILGRNQSTCSGECLVDSTDLDQLPISDSNYEGLLSNYINAIQSPLPPENMIIKLEPAASLPMLNEPGVVCQLASTTAPRLIIFSHFEESFDLASNVDCPALPGRTYTSIREMIEDAVAAYKARGGDLLIFANHLTLGNEGQPVHHNLNTNDLTAEGLVSTTISGWVQNPIPRPNPCANIN